MNIGVCNEDVRSNRTIISKASHPVHLNKAVIVDLSLASLRICGKCYRGREHGAGPACGKVVASSGLWWAGVVLAHGVVRKYHVSGCVEQALDRTAHG